MSLEKERYSFEEAENEAEILKGKIDSGQADNYNDAEKQVNDHIEDMLKQRKVERDPDGRIILYHATYGKFYAMIERDGIIKPAQETGSRAFRLEGEGEKEKDADKKKKVYLADKKVVNDVAAGLQREGGTIYTLEVHVDQNVLRPDEDTRANTWYDSLGWAGLCSHKGSITNYKLLEKKDFQLPNSIKQEFFERLNSVKTGSAEEKEIFDEFERLKAQKQEEEREEMQRILTQK